QSPGTAPEPAELTAARAEFRRVFSEHQTVLQHSGTLSDEIDARFSPYWGAFFKQGPSKTRFARQLETYACLYTSRVSNFGFYGSDHYFRVAHDPMMHELTG
ncbi:MAG: HAD-IG family 5'-nucleotidase, partial [Acidobacteriota bacterium]|nr:HAD-IG family 5'-nucleotidase [Acidobacteriota bacterium]